MSLVTRCAHCHTVFRITPDQLQAHGGQVRCGRCMQVFDGLAALAPDSAKTAADTEPAVVAGTAAASPSALTAVIGPESPLAVAPESVPVPADGLETALRDATDQSDVATMGDDNPFAQEQAAEESPKIREPLLAAASVLLALVLIAQAVYFYRGEIAARYPPLRSWLNSACIRLGCLVNLPQRPKVVLIEASDLQVVDPARPSRIQLTATLRNHAGHDVAYPALDLVLTNANDHTLVRRIFLPAEYLGAQRDPHAGIPANAELTVRLALETGNLGAAGFRLAVLPAPLL